MNIYITCTPEFSESKVDEIIALLSSIPGELKFIKGQSLTQNLYKRLNPKFDDINSISSLSFEEYFDIVQGYRDIRDIDVNDFVILISSIRNNRNWFSAFNKRNIFVHGVEWDFYSNVDSKYGIAHQCVENIFQSLIELDINNISTNPNIHRNPIGCINDYCGHKPEILVKLQSANICSSCYERSVKMGVSDFTMAHIVAILEEIRKQFVVFKKFSSQVVLEKVQIDKEGNVLIGDRQIKMEILPKVLYIGFLKNIQGIASDQICANRNLFDQIYRLIKKNPDEYAIRKMCCNTIEYGNKVERIKPTFHTYRTKIKEALIRALGTTLTNYYHVNLVENDDRQGVYKVNLNNDYIDLDVNFIK